jgi:hypothetical protein
MDANRSASAKPTARQATKREPPERCLASAFARPTARRVARPIRRREALKDISLG